MLPEDGVSVLTPGHFLIGRPLSALPPITSSTGKTFTLRRWNLQRLSDEFWDRWSGEYMQKLDFNLSDMNQRKLLSPISDLTTL